MTTYTVKQTISLSSIQDLFKAHGRGDNFSYEGLQAIMEYIEEVSIDGVVDLDVIGICCDFTECTPREYILNYGLDESDFNYDDVLDLDQLVGYIQENTWGVLLANGNILYQIY